MLWRQSYKTSAEFKTAAWWTFLAVVVVFITPAGRRSGAAAGPASLTLQSGLAQESVVVRGSPRSLPSDPSHVAIFHSKAHQQQDTSAVLETSPL